MRGSYFTDPPLTLAQLRRASEEILRASDDDPMWARVETAWSNALLNSLHHAPSHRIEIGPAGTTVQADLQVVECIHVPLHEFWAIGGRLVAHPYTVRTLMLQLDPPNFDPDIDFPRDNPP